MQAAFSCPSPLGRTPVLPGGPHLQGWARLQVRSSVLQGSYDISVSITSTLGVQQMWGESCRCLGLVLRSRGTFLSLGAVRPPTALLTTSTLVPLAGRDWHVSILSSHQLETWWVN